MLASKSAGVSSLVSRDLKRSSPHWGGFTLRVATGNRGNRPCLCARTSPRPAVRRATTKLQDLSAAVRRGHRVANTNLSVGWSRSCGHASNHRHCSSLRELAARLISKMQVSTDRRQLPDNSTRAVALSRCCSQQARTCQTCLQMVQMKSA
jgi:hypothetical protein